MCYTVNDEGHTSDLPWLYDVVNTPEDARQAYDDAVEWLQQYDKFSVWVEIREIGPWQRVDRDSIA